ncbi:MAG: polysaccharide biosynthesis tyrosine autokinase [Thermoleophilaceae bacterium]
MKPVTKTGATLALVLARGQAMAVPRRSAVDVSDQPRYQTLRDYLRVIRAQRWLILLFIVLFGGAAFAYSARQDPTYEAEAALSFNEPTQDLSFLGVSAFPTETPQQRAAINSELVTRTAVARRVRDSLGLTSSIEELQDAVGAQPEAQTNLVVIEASAGDDEFAALLANEFAEQAAALANQESQDRLEEAEESLRETFRAQSERGVGPIERATFTDRIARLQALQDFGRPVEISRRAEVPSAPASPNPALNTTLGLLLGLALGLLVAFGRDSLDVRLRGSRDIQAHVKLPLVGHIGDDAMGTAGAASRNGHRKMSPADLESFRILRKNLEFLDIDRTLRTIAVTSALPEEGKSTVAASLAGTFAQGGKRTLLVECDLRRPALAERLGLQRTPGLTDYLTEQVSPQEVLQGVPVTTGETNGNGAAAPMPGAEELVCITAGSPVPRPADILASKRFRDFLKEVSEAYDVVVLDTSPLLSVSDTLELIPNVDGVVLCIRAGRTRRDEAKAAKEALDHLPDRPTGLVVTGIKPGDEADYGYYSSSYAYGPTDSGR